jgi:GT2 family glycosyltransferase
MNGTKPQTAVEPRRAPAMSIVVPNYNHGHLIGEALGAMAGQTAAPLEVIVVDDGRQRGADTRTCGQYAVAAPLSSQESRRRRRHEYRVESRQR